MPPKKTPSVCHSCPRLQFLPRHQLAMKAPPLIRPLRRVLLFQPVWDAIHVGTAWDSTH